MDKHFANLEAEKTVLGAAILMPDKIPSQLLSMLKMQDFYSTQHQKIYEAIKELFTNGQECSLPALYDKNIPIEELTRLTETACMEHQLEGFCENIKSHSLRRELLLHTQEFTKRVKTERDGKKLISDFTETMFSLLGDETSDFTMNRDLLSGVFDILEERGKKKGLRGIKTGFVDLDSITGGWQPGHLVFLGAVPKMGKTAIALEFALNAAEQGKSVLFFTMEMSKEELGERQIANRQKVDSGKLITGNLKAEEWVKLTNFGKLENLKLGWVDKAGLTITEIKALCRRFKERHGLDMVVIDQLNKIEIQRKSGETKTDAIERTTTGLKKMCQELKITTICLTQLLDKLVTQRPVPRPQHGDIRDSSAPDQDADIVMYLWRPEFYWPGKYQNKAELIIARQRANVSNTSIWLTWIPRFVSLKDMPREEWPSEVKKP